MKNRHHSITANKISSSDINAIEALQSRSVYDGGPFKPSSLNIVVRK
jgi:hypothetical protein